MRVEHTQKTAYWGQQGFWDWYLDTKRSIIISITVQDSVRPLTTGCCPLSQNQLEKLTTML